MTDQEYLLEILSSQSLNQDSNERKELNKNFATVKTCLENSFGQNPRIIQGGSVIKGTLIRDSYDLDVHFYFSSDDESAGKTLEEIYNSVASALEKDYVIYPKRTAIRLRTRDEEGKFTDLCVDVVPGRYQKDNCGDVFLHQNEGDKERLQTNIHTQITHVCHSGFVEDIRLIKLWNVQNDLNVRTFILELLVIEILKNDIASSLNQKFIKVMQAFSDSLEDLAIEDPANPTGNNLKYAFNDDVRDLLSKCAKNTLEKIKKSGIQSIFELPQKQKASLSQNDLNRLASIASNNANQIKPWFS